MSEIKIHNNDRLISSSNKLLLRGKKQNCVERTLKTGQRKGNIEYIEGRIYRSNENSQVHFISYLVIKFVKLFVSL